jgi:uncharacterized protein YndB with AHSA1/START domain
VNDGILTHTLTGRALTFTRDLDHSADRVWQALADPAERAVWFFAGTLELEVGGTVDLHDSEHGITGTVTAIEPARLLEFTWSSFDAPTSTARFELEHRPTGCRLTFTHEIDDTCRPENLMPGWHCIFEDLSYVLGGQPLPSNPGRFRAHRNRYLQAIGH